MVHAKPKRSSCFDTNCLPMKLQRSGPVVVSSFQEVFVNPFPLVRTPLLPPKPQALLCFLGGFIFSGICLEGCTEPLWISWQAPLLEHKPADWDIGVLLQAWCARPVLAESNSKTLTWVFKIAQTRVISLRRKRDSACSLKHFVLWLDKKAALIPRWSFGGLHLLTT